jgi:hypothetical protein
MDPGHQLEFFIKIEAKFPILRLCDNHYKAESIMFSDYLHWYNAWHSPEKVLARKRKRDLAVHSTCSQKSQCRDNENCDEDEDMNEDDDEDKNKDKNENKDEDEDENEDDDENKDKDENEDEDEDMNEDNAGDSSKDMGNDNANSGSRGSTPQLPLRASSGLSTLSNTRHDTPPTSIHWSLHRNT